MSNDPSVRDAESECWKVFDRLPGEGLEVEALRLKAIELVVKIRSAGPKVKSSPAQVNHAAISQARGKG
jgi:hypothetical protein